jgi:hypothetical protein
VVTIDAIGSIDATSLPIDAIETIDATPLSIDAIVPIDTYWCPIKLFFRE